ncbi:ImmA/IrrE family metallo-endopeptidase [Sedimentibacter sp.]|uniref:ImmA/IrrE family metallo-endopeptidase n=1 Tax=Sedimentibacter sp. TaxID=1960295 RepID=UPI00289F73D7|nr:ImmA/IrrE family metallo-endopeptidase [Sedimentibacter sp.]
MDVGGMILAAIKPSEKLIIMNESKKDLFKEKMGTMNFSKAHELGHWVLHVTEVQADMFAASLLMPKEIISEAVNELKQKGFVTFPELYKMADKFEVSISALTNRIIGLGLLYINNKKIYLSVDEMTGQMRLF